MLIVMDTNVLVSGLLNGEGKPGKIVDLMLENRFQVAYDNRILGEYEDVLSRPELHIHPERARAVIAYIELSGQFMDVSSLPLTFRHDDFQDPCDLPFVEVFLSANAQALVTGNLRHFSALVNKDLPVHSPARFLELFFPDL